MTPNKGTGEKVEQGRGRQRRGNYLPLNPATLQTLLDLQDLTLKKLNITYSSYRDLVTIINNPGITPYRLKTIFRQSDSTFPAMYQRLVKLRDKGLVYTVDRLYYPTDLALREISA